MNVTFVNGKITPEADAVVPVMDRGFLFGDSIYEVVRTYDRVPLAYDQHMARLRASADRLSIQLKFTDQQLAGWIRQTMQASGATGERYIRFIITRGNSAHPNIDPDHARTGCNVVILVRDLDPGGPEVFERGLTVAIPGTLRNDPRSLDPAIKSGNYLNNILGLMEAKKKGAKEAIFLNALREVTEAPTANVGIVKAGKALTPPLSVGILAGVTRAILLEEAQRHQVPFRDQSITVEDLLAADEVFFMSTLRGVLPVTSLEGRAVGNGKPGPVSRQLQTLYEARVAQMIDAARPQWRG